MKVGLALGGGGARGFFHIGMLKVLETLPIKIDYIAGTSAGALIGGLYALRPNARWVESFSLDVLEKHKKEINPLKALSSHSAIQERKIFLEKSFNFVKEFYLWNLRMVKPFLIAPRPFVKFFRDFFGMSTFGDCKIPFVCTAVDLCRGELQTLRNGFLYRTVMASCSYPGVFPPVNIKGKLLVDGGVLSPIPAPLIRKNVDFIIGVDLEMPWDNTRKIKNALDVMFTADRVRCKKVMEECLAEVDFLISFKSSIIWTDFDKVEELIRLGERYMNERKEVLMKRIKHASRRRFFFWLRHRRP